MAERVSGMHSAIRKVNEILLEEKLQNIEAGLRAGLKEEIECPEAEALVREEYGFAKIIIFNPTIQHIHASSAIEMGKCAIHPTVQVRCQRQIVYF